MKPHEFINTVKQIKMISSNLDFMAFCREILGEEPRYYEGFADGWQFKQFAKVRDAAIALSTFDDATLTKLANYTRK